MTPQRVVVVGGGISGLTAAYRLLHPANAKTEVPEVVLIDSAERLGGKILTTPFEGSPVDEGADAFLLRVPWATELCDELGLLDERISPSVGGASVIHPGKLHPQLTPLPDGMIGGVPTSLGPLVRSPLLNPAAKLRAAADCFLPRRFTALRLRDPDRPSSPRASSPGASSSGAARAVGEFGSDASAGGRGAVSVGDLVRTRLGAAVASQVVDPLLGSISAGHIDRLDAVTSAPILVQALERSHSLMGGLRRMQPPRPAGTPAPVFGSFEVGMGRLVEALTACLDQCVLRLGAPVRAIRRPQITGTRFAVDIGSAVDGGPKTGESKTLDADAVIVAAPAHCAAQMLPDAPDATAALGLIDYASVAVVTLSVRADAVEAPTQAGFLVTRNTGWLTTACSYGSAKWPHWSGGHSKTDAASIILRVSVGRDDDDRHTHLDDTALLGAVLAELSSLPALRHLSEPGTVHAWRISRWEQSLPQYRPGHSHLVDCIEEALTRELPGVFVTGAAYRGLGIPACIRQGNEAAAQAVAHLATIRTADSS